ncbi:MAG: HAMP domain-containing histidine kinase, partial [Candidatus Sumerlaeia bacterium]|nr:HAMP domain-containing histidine kinase [Candidatus Sumerlaeia bacterium]
MTEQSKIVNGKDVSEISKLSFLKELRGITRAFQRIHTITNTLNTVASEKDFCYLLLLSLISPYGLGFSQAFCFCYDKQHSVLRGHIGFAPKDKAGLITLWRQVIRDFRHKIPPLALLVSTPSAAIERYKDLNLISSTANQRSPVLLQLRSTSRKIRNIVIDLQARSDHQQTSPLAVACNLKRIIWLKKTEVSELLPQLFLDLLADEFVVIPVCYDNENSHLIFADKRFQPRGIRPLDLLQLEWFCLLTSLVLKNNALIRDLRHTYDEIKGIDEFKNNFLSVISHELRTPLTSIYGFTELLLAGKAGEINTTQQQLLERILQNAHLLINKVNDLLELAHIEIEGLEHLELGPVDTLEVFINILPKMQYRINSKGIKPEPVIKSDLPRILANEKALERIYYHLLDNAIKFSPQNGKVMVEFERYGNEVY